MVRIQCTEGLGMKPVYGMVFAVLAVASVLHAQASNGNNSSSQNSSSHDASSQNKPAASSQNPPAAQQPARTQQQTNQNPFPDDTTSVPVMPSRDSSGSFPD